MSIRCAEPGETAALARLWHDGWHDAHAAIVPEGLVRVRTLESFQQRMTAHLDKAWVIGPLGAPLGFFMLKDDELDQFYVSSAARGTGVAAILMLDAEETLRARGVETAWLACAIGNERAARFYEKSSWHRVGTIVSRLETTDGPFDLSVWRYEKRLAATARASK